MCIFEMKPNPRISLMVATYNWPGALELTLQSALRQSLLPVEILVADDGSTDETRELVQRIAAQSPVPIRHIWHPDEGFRLAAIRNRAIAAAVGDYIVQIDGDIVLHRHFLRDHAAFARPGSFVSGSRLMLTPQRTSQLLAEHDASRLSLWSPGVRHRLNGLRLGWLMPLLSGYKADRTRGCNMAFWREDIVRANGYNESFRGWGAEDFELALRLCNNGVQHRRVKFGAIVFHLYHPERSRDAVEANVALLERTRAEGHRRCEDGIDKYFGR